MLISGDYVKQNKLLHENDPSYGTSGGSVASLVLAIATRLGTVSVLDYGCGKRHLQAALGFSIANYDPAISGYDTPPEPADIVVCSDVLEHVEPTYLDAVLNDLVRLSNRAVLIAVATGPARKTLPDGRNAHLIQNDADWWLERLQKSFRLSRFFTTDHGCVFLGQSLRDPNDFPEFMDIGPPPTMTTVNCKSAYTNEQRCVNIRSAMLRGLPVIRPLPAHDNTMVIAGYGPSLKYTLPELSNDLAREGYDLFTTSGAHRFLIERGYIPVGHLEADPRPHKARTFGKAHPGVAYFLASAASREMFDAVHGHETWIYHVTSSNAETELIASFDPQTFTIDGGTNVGMTAIAFGTALGYRKFSIYGMDCSFECDSDILNWPRDKAFPPNMRDRIRFHAGAHPNEDQPVYRVWVRDRPFLSSPQMFQSAQDFMQLARQARQCQFRLHGDGFLQALNAFIKLRDSRQEAA